MCDTNTRPILVGTTETGLPYLHGCVQTKNNTLDKKSLLYVHYVSGLTQLILSDFLRYKVKFAGVSDTGYGQGYTLENSSGIIRGILEHRADISPPDLDMTHDRSLVLSFGPVLAYSTRTLLVNHKLSHNAHSLKYWQTFTPNCLLTWLALLSTMWLFDRWLSSRFKHYDIRVVKFVLVGSFLVFNAIFNSRLINTRSLSVSKLPFTTLKNSADAINGGKFQLILIPGNGATHEILTSPQYLNLQKNLHNFPAKMINWDAIGNTIVNDEKYFSYIDNLVATSFALNHDGQLETIRQVDSAVVMQGFGVDRKNKKLSWSVTRATLSVIEGGHLDKLKHDVYSRGMERYEIDTTKTISLASRNDLPIELIDLATTFMAVSVCMFLNVGIFGLELCCQV